MIERTTVRLPKDLLAQAKRKAAAEGSTLTALIESGLRLMVVEKPRHAGAARTLPRFSTATGAPFPGIDISDSAALQAIEDHDDAERMTRRR